MTRNTLYYGDNLPILQNRDYFPSESVDLIYLDPPFNSARNYNVYFKDQSGHSDAQIQAFTDTWEWGPTAEATYQAVVTEGTERLSRCMNALIEYLAGRNAMGAYLVMMAARLAELHRVLKRTGSLYLHCDPTSEHYLRMILDAVFGPANFRTAIIWKRTSAHNDGKQGGKRHGRVHDTILFYTKSDTYTWNPLYTEYDDDYVREFYRHTEPDTGRRYQLDNLTAARPGGDVSYEWRVKRVAGGQWEADLDDEYHTPRDGWEYKGVPPYKNRYWAYSKSNLLQFALEGRLLYTASGMPRYKRYLDEMPGVPVQDVWTDIKPVGARAKERMGYPTQKPRALLERIIAMSSKPGDVVLDPFCGCGTTIEAAQKLGRRWIGIDITHLSTTLLKDRLRDAYAIEPGRDYDVVGEPEDVGGARALAAQDRYQFQFWALSLVRGARPLGGSEGTRVGKKGKDEGVDGIITFMDGPLGKVKPHTAVVQVKSGKVSSATVRDLVGTMQRRHDALAFLVTLEPPTKDMLKEAASAGFYHSPLMDRDYPRLQILTVEALLGGDEARLPAPVRHTLKGRRADEQAVYGGTLFDLATQSPDDAPTR